MSAVREFLGAVRNLLVWWVTVSPWEQAIRVRLGKRIALLGPGVSLRIPYADTVYRQTVRRRVTAGPPQTISTSDGHALTVGLTIGYRIDDMVRLYQSVHHPEQTIVAEVMAATADFVVNRTRAECQPAALQSSVREAVRLEQYGLADVTVDVASFVFVRTYRLVTGEGHSVWGGDALSTSNGETALGAAGDLR